MLRGFTLQRRHQPCLLSIKDSHNNYSFMSVSWVPSAFSLLLINMFNKRGRDLVSYWREYSNQLHYPSALATASPAIRHVLFRFGSLLEEGDQDHRRRRRNRRRWQMRRNRGKRQLPSHPWRVLRQLGRASFLSPRVSSPPSA